MKSKTVVVTGASRGIGRQIATDFSNLGYNVVIGYNHSYESANSLLIELRKSNNNVIAIKANLAIFDEAIELISHTINQFGHIDILINNAGISEQKLFTDISFEDWNNMINTNLNSCFVCTQAAVRDMLKRKRGKIINISSIWGITGASCEVHYSTTKAAIIGFTKALAKELGPSGIQVNCIAPGVINTDMNKNLDKFAIDQIIEETPLCKIGSPKDISNTVLFLASDQANFITGQVISPNGGYLM